jgi:short-subunit dehydrogenase
VGEVATLKLEDYRRQFETNVFGVLRTIQATLPELKKTHGRFALMGSVAGHISLPHSSPYSMSKYSVRALAEALTDEVQPFGVSVTLLSPGFVKSEIRRVDNRGKLHEIEKSPLPAWLPMETEVAARKMIRAIRLRRREEVITFHGKCAVFIQRHFPRLVDWFKGRGLSSRSEPSAH